MNRTENTIIACCSILAICCSIIVVRAARYDRDVPESILYVLAFGAILSAICAYAIYADRQLINAKNQTTNTIRRRHYIDRL